MMWPAPRLLDALLKAGIPVVAKVGPVVIRSRVGVADEADLLNLFVTVFDRHGEPQGRAVAGSKRLAAQFINQKALRVHAGSHVKTAKVLAVGRFHVDVAGRPSFRVSGRRISVDEVSQADAAPLDNLAPALDALELGGYLSVRQPAEVTHGEKQAGHFSRGRGASGRGDGDCL